MIQGIAILPAITTTRPVMGVFLAADTLEPKHPTNDYSWRLFVTAESKNSEYQEIVVSVALIHSPRTDRKVLFVCYA